MKKIGFVIPWYAEKIPGGAEMALRGLTTNMKKSGYAVEILTTCVKEFSADWNVNFYKAGEEEVLGVTVRRFPVRKRNNEAFDLINAKLMNDIEISEEEEETFLTEMVNSPKLYEYLSAHADEYSLFVFTPYMFGTTYYGAQVCPQKSVLIPCFHNETYVYMSKYNDIYSKIKGMVFLAQPECELAHHIFDIDDMKTATLGTGIYTDMSYDAARFRRKYTINSPFFLYAGRKDSGKNVDLMLKYFAEYKLRNAEDLKLVLIGGGEIEIPNIIEDEVIELGFVPVQDKYDACAAAEFLCQPSKNESFSLVIMESWLCERPVLVNDACAVTKHFANTAKGGLYFKNYFEFEACINYFINNKDMSAKMGKNGREFVLKNFAWDVIVKNYMKYFNEVSGG